MEDHNLSFLLNSPKESVKGLLEEDSSACCDDDDSDGVSEMEFGQNGVDERSM